MIVVGHEFCDADFLEHVSYETWVSDSDLSLRLGLTDSLNQSHEAAAV